uniref:Uncharacterized protein n=1 Tax=uncultured bacterium contig00051 TaxID=1181535 RepID=A0A806KPF4_9BACT|nr:hypothetical protein [uncultured bacterium contig00051]
MKEPSLQRLTHRNSIFLFILMFAAPFSLPAVDFDFGLLANQNAVLENNTSEDAAFEYHASVVPRLLLPFGGANSFYVSAGVNLGYSGNGYFVPELLRTELAMRFGAWGLKAGRISYSHPVNFLADGLFDGVHVSNSSAMGRFGLGALYTGLIYKKTLNIQMTAADRERNSAPFAYDNFAGTYSAPKRFLALLDWEHPSIGEFLWLRASLTGQFDLNENSQPQGGEKLHSQYLSLKGSFHAGQFLFEIGGIFGTAQTVTADDGGSFNIALAGELGVNWTLPSNFHSRLLFTLRYASGKQNDTLGAFAPITAKYYGEIFEVQLTGITVFGMDYAARLTSKLGASLAALYFVRNDLVTANNYPITAVNNEGYFLGGEFFGRVIWSPFSDLQCVIGAGAFIPAMGDVWQDQKALLKMELSLIFAVF